MKGKEGVFLLGWASLCIEKIALYGRVFLETKNENTAGYETF